VGSPEEVADLVAYLLGPKSSYVHGALIDVSGGR
jgi:NAD(P)-dependent dehydrogenase (short-subunit alcohol dehydrogenase family)